MRVTYRKGDETLVVNYDDDAPAGDRAQLAATLADEGWEVNARVTTDQCPECRNGKHPNCTGWALDAADEVVSCGCSCREATPEATPG